MISGDDFFSQPLHAFKTGPPNAGPFRFLILIDSVCECFFLHDNQQCLFLFIPAAVCIQRGLQETGCGKPLSVLIHQLSLFHIHSPAVHSDIHSGQCQVWYWEGAGDARPALPITAIQHRS